MRCIMSPVCLVSKKAMGRVKSLQRKSETMARLTLMLTWSSSQRRTKSMAVELSVSMSCPASTSHTKPMSRWAMPRSTMAWVSSGSSSCRALPTASHRVKPIGFGCAAQPQQRRPLGRGRAKGLHLGHGAPPPIVLKHHAEAGHAALHGIVLEIQREAVHVISGVKELGS